MIQGKKRIILASKSPRRQELLRLGGIEYEVEVSGEEEIIKSHIPHEVVEELSLQKARAVYNAQKDKGNIIVIGADTVVAYQGQILGKPEDKEDARRMLTMLSGATHEVYTGVTIIWKDDSDTTRLNTFSECTRVTFYPLDDMEISSYIDSGDPMDKAGAYGIQSGAARYVEKIDGDYNNVVGLPLARLYHELKKMNLI